MVVSMTEQRREFLNRRHFLTGIGGSAAALAVAPLVTRQSASAATAPAVVDPVLPTPVLALAEIQGNIIGGFNKDHQMMLFLRFPPAASASAWLTELTPHIATAAEVTAFSLAFKAVVARSGSEVSAPKATWVNVAFTHDGLARLRVAKADLDVFPEEYRVGMAARAEKIGDHGPNAPTAWPAPYRDRSHAVVIVAADRPADLASVVAEQRSLAAKHGAEVLFAQEGATRADEPGHEHFGFKDGVSQPGIRGVTVASNPANPNQGVPGQDLLWPGEFVLGYPGQFGVGKEITEAGPVSRSGPAWTVNGSYLVFRRLRQDVAGFREFMRRMAEQQGVSEDLMGAKLVGRYKSGAPLEATGMKMIDPALADPSVVGDDKINAFEFGDDKAGAIVPLASHIRKSYPRDDETRDGGESDTQTHRLLRRGIPFGASLPRGSTDTGDAFGQDRGLLFLCYQTSIARQFEFVQSKWVNDPNFSKDGSGHDPIISQVNGPRSMALPGGRPDHVALMQRFVLTTGGDYFFQPSITALRLLSVAATLPTPTPPPARPAVPTRPPVNRPQRPAPQTPGAPGAPQAPGRPKR